MPGLPIILIADDSSEFLFLLETSLRKFRARLILAHSGKAALEACQGLSLALALVDVHMPGMSGFELARQLNPGRAGEKLPVIFMTNDLEDPVLEKEGYDSGAVDYLYKPVNMEKLKQKISIFLELYNQKQDLVRNGELLARSAEELQQLNAALRNSEEKYRKYIDDALDGVIALDSGGGFLEANGSACRITGYSREELLEMSLPALLPEEPLGKESPFFQWTGEGELSKSEVQLRLKDGSLRWWRTEVFAMEETCFLRFTRDTTETREAEAFREASFELLQILNTPADLKQNLDRILLSLKNHTGIDAIGIRMKQGDEFPFMAQLGFDNPLTERRNPAIKSKPVKAGGKKKTAVTQPLCICKLMFSGKIPGNHPCLSKNGSFITGDAACLPEGLPPEELLLLSPDCCKSPHGNSRALIPLRDRDAVFGLLHFADHRKDRFNRETLVFMEDIASRIGAALLRIRAEENLRSALDDLEKSQRIARIGNWRYLPDERQFIASAESLRIFGFPAGSRPSYREVMGCLHPASAAGLVDRIMKALETDGKYAEKVKIIRSGTGEECVILSIGEVSLSADGLQRTIIGTNQDITEQSLLEEKLVSGEANFRNFFQSMSDLIVVGNQAGKVLFTNDAVSLKLGYSADELRGMFIMDLHPMQFRLEAVQIFADMFAGKRDSCPLPLARKDGLQLPVETRIWPGKWNGKEVIFGYSRDLSSENEALQKFNKLFYNNPALMAISTVPNGVLTDVNNTFLKVTGYTREEVIGKSSSQIALFVHPDRQKNAAGELINKGSVQNLRLKIRTKNGEERDGIFFGEIIESQGKKLFLTVMVDVTESRTIERRQLESEKKYRLLIEMAREGILITQDDRMRYANPVMEELTGYKPEELLGMRFIELVHPADRPLILESYWRRLQGLETAKRYQFRVIKKNREQIWFEMSGVLVEWEGVAATMNFLTDISSRKQAEIQQQQHLAFTTALNKMTEDILSSDRVETILESANRILGETLQLDRSLIYKVSFPQNRISSLCEWIRAEEPRLLPCLGRYSSLDQFRAAFTEMHRSRNYLESHRKAVNPLLIPGGAAQILHRELLINSLLWYPFAFDDQGFYVFTLNQVLEPRNWTKNELDFLESVSRKLSLALMKIRLLEERKSSETALLESEANLAEAQRIARMGSWELDLASGVVKVSDAMYQLYDFDPRAFDGKMESLYQLILPEERGIFENRMRDAFSGMDTAPFEYHILRRDGSLHLIQSEARAECDETGKTLRIIGISQDITERKRVEEELRNSYEELHNLTRHIEIVRENERVTISRDLHDDLGQALTALKIDVGFIRDSNTDPKLSRDIDAVFNTISDTILSVQRLTARLRPEIIEDLGLEAAVEWYVSEFSNRNRIKVVQQLDLDLPISSGVSLAIFRILQESLTNISRHSGASSLEISLGHAKDSVQLIISDNGIGITEEQLRSKNSYGIISMKERTTALGGIFTITGQARKGTTICLTIPGGLS